MGEGVSRVKGLYVVYCVGREEGVTVWVKKRFGDGVEGASEGLGV